MKVIDLFKFKKLVDGNKPFVVKFKSDDCPVCIELKDAYLKTSESFPEIGFYDVDINEDEDLADMFVEDGVPTLYFIKGQSFTELEYPDDGFDLNSLTKEIKKYLKGKSE